jgi:hypothetical protein
MKQVKNELALANAQELMNVRLFGFSVGSYTSNQVFKYTESKRKVLCKVYASI